MVVSSLVSILTRWDRKRIWNYRSYAFTLLAVLDGALLGLNAGNLDIVAAASGVFDPSSVNYGNQWALFDDYFKAVIKVCAKELVAKYGCILAGVDLVIDSHCRVVQSFWRVEC
jgi:hypothetical protein